MVTATSAAVVVLGSLLAVLSAAQCVSPTMPCAAVVGAACGNGTECALGLLCHPMQHRCVDGPDGLPCQGPEECNFGLYLSGFHYNCDAGRCKAVGLAGDACGAHLPPCVGLATCAGSTQCVPVLHGKRCIHSADCGVTGYCSNNTCVDAPFVGEDCPDGECQTGSFCFNGVCQLLFTQDVGKPCNASAQCNAASLCVDHVCAAIPGDYNQPCPCASKELSCVCGTCQFVNILGSQMDEYTDCRGLMSDAYTCAGLIGCDPEALSCNLRGGCYYEYTRLRNCFLCASTVSSATRVKSPCLLNSCGNPGMAKLTLVLISTGAVCAALLVVSVLIFVYERRKTARQTAQYTAIL